MSCEKFGYEFSWIIPLLCCFPFLYANASTIKASREIENVPAFVGGDLRYSWQINTQNLSRIVLLLDNVHVLSSKKGNFPGTSCVVLMSKKILNLCKNKIKPNSSVKDGKFNLVINRITEKYLDKSVWKLILDYPKTQNLSSSIRIMLKETSAPTPGCPTGSCKPCPPTPGCPTGSCKPCPPNPGCPSIPCPTPSSDNGWMIVFFISVVGNVVMVAVIFRFKYESEKGSARDEEPSHGGKCVKNLKNLKEKVKRRVSRNMSDFD